MLIFFAIWKKMCLLFFLCNMFWLYMYISLLISMHYDCGLLSKRCQEDQQCSLMTKSPTSVKMLVCPTPGTWLTWLTRWFSSSFSGIEWVIWCLDFMWDIHVTQMYPGTSARSFWNVLSCLPMRMLCDIIPACLSGMPSPFLVSKSRAWWAYRWMSEGRYDAEIMYTYLQQSLG